MPLWVYCIVLLVAGVFLFVVCVVLFVFVGGAHDLFCVLLLVGNFWGGGHVTCFVTFFPRSLCPYKAKGAEKQ